MGERERLVRLAVTLIPPGRLANVVFLSWLYAFYCFDYGWSLQGVPLPERLAFFERRWAFFAGRPPKACFVKRQRFGTALVWQHAGFVKAAVAGVRAF